MQSHVRKWGNSLALRIPKPFAQEMGLDHDMKVDLSLEDKKLIVIPATEPHVTLERLLEQITEANIYHEIDTGPAIGKEVW
ncbi:MAG: AbrB/MazE/SpoVT family DNA-binding domain-containing protein [Dehalococcoidia bacterium]|nr:AbrB/MazE/SpoVT family DNA-binding domain-containing protein [Dehalococcoidia bacterium]